MNRRVLFLILAAMVPALVEGQEPPSAKPASSVPAAQATPDPSVRRTMTAVRMNDDESIELDGRLDEGVWRRTMPATDFIQQDPNNGQLATEQTEVRIVYNTSALYMGVTCFDSEPNEWLGFQRGRDGFLSADDRFMWTIDTFQDGRTAYFFEMNPSGSMADALQGVGNASNRQWDGIWTGRARRSKIGWTLEIEIPFRTLNFNPDSDTWGINFQRTVRRKNEESLWIGWLRNQGLRRMTNAGLVTGIRDVSQGKGLDIKPYLASTFQSAPGRGDSSVSNDTNVGVDLFYNITPGLRANLTVNTDFAQAEVDTRQVNLTRFSLFFPEKRDFFLDGSIFFDFADAGRGSGATGGGPPVDVVPFFSRRIGLDERGQPQRINVGGKLTGQAGAFDVGILHVRTGEEGSGGPRGVASRVPGEDFTVARIKRRLLRQSHVGAIYTRRAARGVQVDDRHTMGLDFELATSTFMGSENIGLRGYFLRTTNPRDLGTRDLGKNAAMSMVFDYPNDPWNVQLDYREVQENYDAAIGFTRRSGFRNMSPRLAFSPRPRQHRWIRRFNFATDVEWFLDPDNSNQLLTREADFTIFQMDFHSQDSFQIHVLPNYQLLEQDFAIAPQITLPVGREYRFTRYRVQGSTAGRRLIAVSPIVEWGDFYSGERLQLGLNVDVRARPGLMFTLGSEWNHVSLAEGQLYSNLFRGIAETQFSPWISLVNNVQYETQSRVLGWQSRFRWIVKPGNDLYFVYIHNWLDDPLRRRFSTLDRRAASKVLYTHRF